MISVGLSQKFADGHEMLAHVMVMYDVLYASCAEQPRVGRETEMMTTALAFRARTELYRCLSTGRGCGANGSAALA